MHGREARVRFQGCFSIFITLENGTPLGGILSPFLFNLLVERLVSLATSPGVQVLCYANDLTVVATGPNHLGRAQVILYILSCHCAELGLSVNGAKTNAMSILTVSFLPLLL